MEFTTFDKAVQKANTVLKRIEEYYGWGIDRRIQSYSALKVVLHLLRDRLTVDEAANFSAQLPMVIRGMFFEGWNPSSVPKKLSKKDFLKVVKEHFTYSYKGTEQELTKVVLNSIASSIEPHELDKLKKMLPDDLIELLD